MMSHKSLISLEYSSSQTIAKVGVEGSNPFARSNRTKPKAPETRGFSHFRGQVPSHGNVVLDHVVHQLALKQIDSHRARHLDGVGVVAAGQDIGHTLAALDASGQLLLQGRGLAHRILVPEHLGKAAIQPLEVEMGKKGGIQAVDANGVPLLHQNRRQLAVLEEVGHQIVAVNLDDDVAPLFRAQGGIEGGEGLGRNRRQIEVQAEAAIGQVGGSRQHAEHRRVQVLGQFIEQAAPSGQADAGAKSILQRLDGDVDLAEHRKDLARRIDGIDLLAQDHRGKVGALQLALDPRQHVGVDGLAVRGRGAENVLGTGGGLGKLAQRPVVLADLEQAVEILAAVDIGPGQRPKAENLVDLRRGGPQRRLMPLTH